MTTPDNRIAVCAGSYDPVTNGHLDVIARASAMYDQVIVGVANSPFRKSTPLFTAEFASQMNGQKGMAVDVLIRRAIAAIEAGKTEIRPDKATS